MRHSLFLPALALCMCSLPGMADTLFSDLGTGGSVYDSSSGWEVSGSGSGTGQSIASLFTVSGSGSNAVTQIDLAVTNANRSLDTFYAAIWTDNAGLPGTQVAGADWSLSTSASFPSCCGLVSVTGITGVTLTGGQSYFMVLGPVSLSDASSNSWNWNNQGVTGLLLGSSNGGSTWAGGTQTLGAFDVLSTPEPGTMFMLGVGLLALGFLRKRLHP